jgi:hypothetical protein
MSRPLLVRRARRVARHASDASVRVTSPLRSRPGFLIVGAQRCGTTSMFKALVQHPLVARPFLRKGVHYFDKHYDEGPAWYRGHFPLQATSALKRVGRGRPVTGESSPYYMFHPLAPQRIAADLPGVRLIVLLRDPVERAYSAHSHELAKGFETLDFAAAVDAEPARIAGERERMRTEAGYDSFDLQHHAYVSRGEYVTQLEELATAVGRDRVLAVDSQDFFAEPEKVFPGVLDFLGLPAADSIVFDKHNARSRSTLDPALRERQRQHYEPFDQALESWWGRTPSWRR